MIVDPTEMKPCFSNGGPSVHRVLSVELTGRQVAAVVWVEFGGLLIPGLDWRSMGSCCWLLGLLQRGLVRCSVLHAASTRTPPPSPPPIVLRIYLHPQHEFIQFSSFEQHGPYNMCTAWGKGLSVDLLLWALWRGYSQLLPLEVRNLLTCSQFTLKNRKAHRCQLYWLRVCCKHMSKFPVNKTPILVLIFF